MSDDARPIWLTPHMGNRIYNLLVADGHVREADAFRLTWDAAPADARTDAIEAASKAGPWADKVALAVLDVLGMP